MTRKRSRKPQQAVRSAHRPHTPLAAPDRPNDPRLTHLLAQALGHHRQNNLTDAESGYRAILASEPTHADALHLLGLTYAQRGDHQKAVEYYREALIAAPVFAGALNNLGISLNAIGEFLSAIDSFRQSLEINPHDADTCNNLGSALNGAGRHKEAIKYYKKAIQLNPKHTDAYYNLGNVQSKLFDYEKAIKNYQQALTLNPDHFNAYSSQAFMLQSVCDWENYEAFRDEIVQKAQLPSSKLPPFYLLSWSDDPAVQLAAATNRINNTIPATILPLNPEPPRDGSRIRVAYLSADFREHPVAYLSAELYELHDREQFEISAIAYGPDDTSAMRQRLVNAFDHFYTAGNMSDEEIARLIVAKGIHIAVDLTGHTLGARPGVLAGKPAPIQVNFLGYTGSMGAKFFDYIITDAIAVPEDQQPFFSEQLIHLPNCYMPSDSKKAISAHTPTRTQCGLPETGFVFCCFNNEYKLTPEIFDIWISCLKAVENSILWLKSNNQQTQKNLRKEAQARGVDSARLYFAPYIENPADHLARYKQADLFLDTHPYGAHTTANDALSAGLPVLSYSGNSFVSRVGSTLLHAAGIAELAVDSLVAYETLAIELARSPEKLATMRCRLIANRDCSPLFDSRKFCRQLEHEFTNMWESWNKTVIDSTNSTFNKTEDSGIDIEASFKHAVELHRQNNLKKAQTIYQEILSLNRSHAGALHYSGIIYAQQGEQEAAIKLYQKSIAIDPAVSEVHNNLGVAFNSLKRYDEALQAFQRAVETGSDNTEAYHNLGGVLYHLDQKKEAKACLMNALKIKPEHDGAHNSLAVLLSQQKQFDEAEKHFLEAIRINPEHVGALNNLGNINIFRKNLQAAVGYFQRALEIDPAHSNSFSQLTICLRKLCDWQDFDTTRKSVIQWQQSGNIIPNAFSFLLWSDDPAAQQQCARAYTSSVIPQALKPINATPPYDSSRIKVAFLSADFREHPVAHLTAGLYELLDRRKFEVTAIAYDSGDASPMRQRLLNAFDHFHAVGDMSDHDVAKLIAAEGIHITIDLMGHTSSSRPNVLAYRAAPVQINYLGYIGTMGCDFIDYILVDQFCAPEKLQPYFDEQLVHLPCYMVTDTQRKISETTPTRAASGLPDDGFVFCSFNNCYKITPEIFDIWMRCLSAVPNSVLWLLADNEPAQQNLRNEAIKRGIEPSRLIFATRVDPTDHLARQRLADLFLDTLPINAGATASDALSAGLPLLTCAGKSFAARMGGALLHAANMPELVTESPEAYETLAIELATNPSKLMALREKLAANRNSAPLFNSRGFCLSFETALINIWERWYDIHQQQTAEPSQQLLQTMLEKSVAKHQQGDLDSAEQAYREILALDPRHPDALHLLGVINTQRGDIDKAIDLFHQSIEANPAMVSAYNNLGIALHNSRRPKEAAASFRKAIQISPNADAYYNLGNCLYSLGDYKKAIENYKQVLTLNPNHKNARQNMNVCLAKSGNR